MLLEALGPDSAPDYVDSCTSVSKTEAPLVHDEVQKQFPFMKTAFSVCNWNATSIIKLPVRDWLPLLVYDEESRQVGGSQAGEAGVVVVVTCGEVGKQQG